MSDLIADIQNGSLWEEVYSVSKVADPVSEITFKPIPEIVVPFPITSRLIIVFADSEGAPLSWHSAGWLSRYITTGVTVGGTYSTKLGYSRRCLLRKFIMIDWDTYGQTPRYSFIPHKWLQQISLRFWQFTGNVTNEELERIDLARISLARIETALTFIAQRDQVTTYNVDL